MRSENYDFRSVEPKWRKLWDEERAFALDPDERKPKFYCLVMFPYPSGKIHMGHARNYCIGDVIARYKKMRGFRVLHPLGWDAFGLPAENAAIQHKIDPGQWTRQNIRDMGQDIRLLGISYDWDREFATCDEGYYRWNQWFFVQMFRRGLAYRKKSAVNWCPDCRTVLANEQVHEGKCWRCASAVLQKDLDQWFFKVTDYAERLLEDLKTLEGHWPDEVIAMQRNWIGKSAGALVRFGLEGGSGRSIEVFTTRPDTLYGCTFLVVSPESALAEDLPAPERRAEVRAYVEQARRKTREERLSAEKDKSGVFTGAVAVNPVNGAKVPVWIADYVLSDYGTGAIMAVPAHDQRDFDFARKFDLPVVQVIAPKDGSRWDGRQAFEADGDLMNSGEFSGRDWKQAGLDITRKLESQGKGEGSVHYRIRDWLLSRQRYWGTPIPVIYCQACGCQPVPEKDLPVVLPKNVQFTGKGESPLAQVPEFVNAPCPACGRPGRRETDTMDTFVDSSWYFLRYIDPRNASAPFERKLADQWMPVDQYIGGIEHACMHLIYSRFFHKLISDLGWVGSKEPFQNLLTQGMVTLGGAAMSKSKGNAVPVEDMAREYGADTARLFVLFASPPRNQLEWSEDGVQGSWRFLNRVWRMGRKIAQAEGGSASAAESDALRRKAHQTVKKVGEDIEKDFQFNTAIAALMELLNLLQDYPAPGDAGARAAYQALVALLFPFAPHLASEIWEEMGFDPKDTLKVPWPQYDPEWIQESSLEVVLQVNGKLRGKVAVPAADARDEKKVLEAARSALAGKGLGTESPDAKYRFVPGRLVNFIVPQISGVEAQK